jgi:hypothetical protein
MAEMSAGELVACGPTTFVEPTRGLKVVESLDAVVSRSPDGASTTRLQNFVLRGKRHPKT